MQNITELREKLTGLYEKVEKKEVSRATANTLANIAGKVINSLTVELSYNQFMEISQEIDFLESKATKNRANGSD